MSFDRGILRSCKGLLVTAAAVTGLLAITTSSTGQPVPAAATPSQSATQLAAVCTPETVNAVAASLGAGVTVQHIRNGPPMVPGGVKFTPKGARLNAFCQVTGSFVTNPATGKTAN